MWGIFKRKKQYNEVEKLIMSGECYPLLAISGDARVFSMKLMYKGQEVVCSGVLINTTWGSDNTEYIDGIPVFKIKEVKK